MGSKRIPWIKYQPDGLINRCKAKLMAKSFSQTIGIDYTETFAPVVCNAFSCSITLSVSSCSWACLLFTNQPPTIAGDYHSGCDRLIMP